MLELPSASRCPVEKVAIGCSVLDIPPFPSFVLSAIVGVIDSVNSDTRRVRLALLAIPELVVMSKSDVVYGQLSECA